MDNVSRRKNHLLFYLKVLNVQLQFNVMWVRWWNCLCGCSTEHVWVKCVA